MGCEKEGITFSGWSRKVLLSLGRDQDGITLFMVPVEGCYFLNCDHGRVLFMMRVEGYYFLYCEGERILLSWVLQLLMWEWLFIFSLEQEHMEL